MTTEEKSVSLTDLFATLEPNELTNFSSLGDFHSGSGIRSIRAKERQLLPESIPRQALLYKFPDFSSYERHELVVESENNVEVGPPSSGPLFGLNKKLSALSIAHTRNEDNTPPVFNTITERDGINVFCSTPGPTFFSRRNLVKNKNPSTIPLEQFQATPIPCPHPNCANSPSARNSPDVRCSRPLLTDSRCNAQMPAHPSPHSPESSKKLKDEETFHSGNSVLRRPSHEIGTLTGKRSGALLKRLTRHLRVDNLLLNRSYWALYTAGDSKSTLLKLCGQTEYKRFAEVFTPFRRRHAICKVGEGCYGEVFKCVEPITPTNGSTPLPSVAVKMIPIEGTVKFNGDPQKNFGEVLSEVIVSKELTALSLGTRNQTDGFVQLKRVHLLQGAVPSHLIKAWESYHRKHRSENDHPRIFQKNQVWLIMELSFIGASLELDVPTCPAARLSIVLQVGLALAVAECELRFEHRDLHWGNVLIRRDCGHPQNDRSVPDCVYCTNHSSTSRSVIYRVDDHPFRVPAYGVNAVIIDFTMSRLEQDGGLVYVDLAADPTLFESKGDYQFDVYRLMRDQNHNRWERFCPKTNVMWLHYLATKLASSPVTDPISPPHKRPIRQLRQLQSDLGSFSYGSALELVQQHPQFTSYRSPV